MTVSNSDLTPRQEVRDWLFAQLGGQPHRNAAFDNPRSLDGEPDERLSDALPQSAPSEPPAIRGPEDLRAANEWVQKERQRLEAYTRNQLASIQQQHNLLISQNYLHEQNLILRSQELARKEKLVLVQGETLQQQSQDLAKREEALVGQFAVEGCSERAVPDPASRRAGPPGNNGAALAPGSASDRGGGLPALETDGPGRSGQPDDGHRATVRSPAGAKRRRSGAPDAA